MLKKTKHGYSFILYRSLLMNLFFAQLTVLGISGCSAEQQTKLAHVKGVLAWKQGNWNNAVLYFYEAESLSAGTPDNEIRHYTDFALASTYLMQQEDTAAEKKLDNIPETTSDLLRTHRFYQQGIIAFRSNQYAQAAALFRKSLELSGDDTAAKINYELSKKLSGMQQEVQHQAPQHAAEDPEANLTDSIVLDIIRKREQNKWKKMHHESEPAINDY